MDDRYLVSIIVPVYNSERYVKKCIDSILKQKYQNIEVIIVDDGSTDKSLSVCFEYYGKNEKVVILSQSNSGVSVARNCGIENSKGEFICFVDSDDIISENYVIVLLEHLLIEKVNAVYMQLSYMYTSRILKRKTRLPEGKYEFKNIEHYFIDDGTLSGILQGSVCGAIFYHKIIEKFHVRFREGVKSSEDGIFNFEYLHVAENFFVLDDSSHYFYRKEKNNDKYSVKKINYLKSRLYGAEKNLYQLNNEYYIKNFDIQIKRRKITEIMIIFESYTESDLKFIPLFRAIRYEISKINISDWRIFNINNMTCQKKWLFKMIIGRHYFILAFAIKYIYPLLKRRVRR